MKFESACKKAMEYFKKEYNDVGLYSIMDLGDSWLFDGTDAEQTTVYGKLGLTINKITGETGLFYLPDDRNFERLERAVALEIPREYRITI